MTLFEGKWNSRPYGCFVEEIGSKLIYYNIEGDPTEVVQNDSESVSSLCQWECLQPNSEQSTVGLLGCQCVEGYLSETGEQILEDDQVCIPALNSTYITVTSSKITYRSEVVTVMNNRTVTQKASPNDILIDMTEKFSMTQTIKANGNVEYTYTFFGLDPGHRYNIEFTYDSNGEEKDMKFPAVTSCSACSNTDKTGSPTNFEAFQDNGHVMFTFEDCSLCEEAYSFTRTSYEDGNYKPVSFTSDYFFIPKQASGSIITPFTRASDDLLKSKLIVGKYYEYCVRAVHPVLYMDHPFDIENAGRTLLSSNDTCADHRIRWEASIHGKVTTEPTAGTLPVEGVNVTYELLNDNLLSGDEKYTPMECDGCSGSLETTEGGSFNIAFNVDHEVLYEKNTHEIPVKVTFTKSTIGDNNAMIEHRFLCNEGEDDCSGDIGTIVYLSHLQFREPLHVYDDTSVPFSGKISIADTPYDGAPEGCAISGVEVCLIHERNVGGGVMKINETLVCGDTDTDGKYSVPVIIGSRVDYVDLSYNNHTFELSQPSNFVPGTVIEAERDYDDMNFVDTQKARLMVDVVGGLCNKFIGESKIQFQIPGCDWKAPEQIQSAPRGIYDDVPAHLLDVQVVDITDSAGERYDHIWDFFQGEQPLVRTIDLRSTGAADAALQEERESLSSNSTTGIKSKDDIKQDEEKNLDTITEEEEEDLELVRFQYDGKLQMEVSVFPDSFEECSEHSLTDGNSYHVLEYMTYFLVRVDLKYEIIKDQEVYCDIVDDELKLYVVNEVGVDGNADGNAGWQEFYNSISNEKTKEGLMKCKDGCYYDIGHEEDEEGNPVSGANVTDWFATGRPNIVAPFTKFMKFTIEGAPNIEQHKAVFVIEGYYSKGPGRSFALPTHKPIMILRDPPGGLSYARYDNIVTTMKLGTSSWSRTHEGKFGFGAKLVVDYASDVCKGGGVGVTVELCNELLSVRKETRMFDVEFGLGRTFDMNDNTRSNQFSTAWSYQTSSDPMTAGAMSDVFVVPNLNVMYEEVLEVKWENCTVTTEDDGTLPTRTIFDIEAPENEPALAFFSRYHVDNVKIPELETAIANKESQKSDCECTDDNPNKACKYYEADDTQKTTTCDEIDIDIEFLQAGLDGWNTTLKEEKDSFDLLTSDTSKSINNWFNEFGAKDMYNLSYSVGLNGDQTSGLAPPSLTNNAEALDNELLDGRDDDGPVKRIQFSGGGNTFSMTMSKEKLWNQVKLACWDGCNFEADNNVKGPGKENLEAVGVGIGVGFNFNLAQIHTHISHKSTVGETGTAKTSISFVLGDSDRTDEFVVDLYYDDKYGTVIFKTVGGQSRCPHEEHTAVIEDPTLKISNLPDQHVFPGEDLIFELEIINVGIAPSSFMMYAQHHQNEGGLQLMLDGAPFGQSRQLGILDEDTTYKKILTVQRGPLLYQYPSLDLVLQSSCDWKTKDTVTLDNFNVEMVNEQGENITKGFIKFVEPCPKVEWAGELKRDRHFVVNTNSDDQENLKVSVFNPNHGSSKFHSMTSDRLQTVLLNYREVGDLQWRKAKTEITNDDGSVDPLKLVDFAAEYAYEEEDDYGYSTLNWTLANVPEGTYEIKVDAKCDLLGGPADMDSYSTPILSGVIDLTRPEQYGRALPLRESILIGEEMVVLFTEPVRPEEFDLRLTVHLGSDESDIADCGQFSKCSRRDLKQQRKKRDKKQKKEKDPRNRKKRRKSLQTEAPSVATSTTPSLPPSEAPSLPPSEAPSVSPSEAPSVSPSEAPSVSPSTAPTRAPVVLDRKHPAIQIVSYDRKIGFQIDPTQINVEDWIGKRFEVEIGKINTFSIESLSNIFDLNGNAIEGNVIFEKTFANIDLDEASISFTVTLNDMEHCSDVDSQLCAGEIKDKIASLLSLSSSDEDRIEVETVSADFGSNTSTVSARVKILPTKNTRMLRNSGAASINSSSSTDHAVGLFRQLQSTLEEEQTRVRVLGAIDNKSAELNNMSIVRVSDMKILPGDSDIKLLQTNPAMKEEEEELYRYASMKEEEQLYHYMSMKGNVVDNTQPILTKVERQAMVEELEVKIDEIDIKSKSREEAMMNEMKEESKSREEAMMNEITSMNSLLREMKENKEKSQSELKTLRFELTALTLASVAISLIAFFFLRHN